MIATLLTVWAIGALVIWAIAEHMPSLLPIIYIILVVVTAVWCLIGACTPGKHDSWR